MDLTGIGKVYQLWYGLFAFVRISMFSLFWFLAVWRIGKDGDLVKGFMHMVMAILSFWFLDELLTIGGAFAGGAIMLKTAGFLAYVMMMIAAYFLIEGG